MTGRPPLPGKSPLPSGIEGLATLLKRAKFNVDGENLADALWLAQQITPAAAPKRPTDESTDQTEASEPKVEIRQKSPQEKQTDRAQSLSLNLESNQGQRPQSSQGNKGTFQTPAPPALRETLSLGRSFRPLMRKVDSHRKVLLDEEATADRTAEQKLCIPVLKPAPERWLEVALVVEESRSRVIWKDIIDDFQRLLERQGAFRDVRTWSLVANSAGEPELYSKRHMPFNRQRVRSPREILDPSGRRLIILISDCISPLWQTGKVLELLQLWYRECPLTILQLLPEKLWERSVLGASFPVELSALIPVAVNAQLLTEGLPIWEDIDLEKALKIPVITLEADSILAWARVLAGAGNVRTAGVVFDEVAFTALAEAGGESEVDESEAEPSQKAEFIVQQFQETASPLARRLAGYLAMVPVSPPIISLIQSELLPNSRQIHVAEIIMSGLLQPASNSGQGSSQSKAAARFQFAHKVREELRQSVPKSETEAVLQAISQYIAQKAGISIRSFTALLTLSTDQMGESAEDIEEFARLTRPLLRQLGGHYAALAETLGDEKAPAPFQLKLPRDWPKVKRCEFEVARLVRSRDGLSTFEFETATLQVMRQQRQGPIGWGLGGLLRALTNQGGNQPETRIEIIKEQRQGRQRVEQLSDDLILEMMLLPSRTFMMGSPADEPERSDDEGPQHEVTIAPFFMGKYPITQAQWRFVANLSQINRELPADPAIFKGDNRPVEQVSWEEAVEFCDRLSQFTGRDYRLPSEAQWEYACRAGTTTPFHFGETITTDLANYQGTDEKIGDTTYRGNYGDGPKGVYRKATTDVGSFPANTFGLYDLHGNVFEWCQDVWHDSYEGAPTDGSAWVEGGNQERRILRGGSWNLNPRFCRSAYRLNYNPGDRLNIIGFRVICFAPGLQ